MQFSVATSGMRRINPVSVAVFFVFLSQTTSTTEWENSCKRTGEWCDCNSCDLDCCNKSWNESEKGWCWCTSTKPDQLGKVNKTCLPNGKECPCWVCGSNCCTGIWTGEKDWCQCTNCLTSNTTCNCSWCEKQCCSQQWTNKVTSCVCH